MREIKLQDLKAKTPAELLAMAAIMARLPMITMMAMAVMLTPLLVPVLSAPVVRTLHNKRNNVN